MNFQTRTRSSSMLIAALVFAGAFTMTASAQDQRVDTPVATLAVARAELADEIVANWAAHSVELGFTERWDTELRDALMGLTADRLLSARSAKTYRELNSIISGMSVGTLDRLLSGPIPLDAAA